MWRQSVGFVGGARGVETWMGDECVSTRARAGRGAPKGGCETCGFIGILVPKYPWGPKISMGGGDPSLEKSVLIAPGSRLQIAPAVRPVEPKGGGVELQP